MTGYIVFEVWCDTCGTVAEGESTLRELRKTLLSQGWGCHRGEPGKPMRDFCPDCEVRPVGFS